MQLTKEFLRQLKTECEQEADLYPNPYWRRAFGDLGYAATVVLALLSLSEGATPEASYLLEAITDEMESPPDIISEALSEAPPSEETGE